ncbi:unnamed protein product [Lactuca saligna]|uniref:Uncharacterized protein n=1 Tax=Lactuca saligna TaxID=75948 RepID=A0AA35YIX5_LACSI|nr:unnamed protein product [Lactuca saligna]
MHLSLLRLMMLLKFSRFSLASATIYDITLLRLAFSATSGPTTSGPPLLNSLVSPSPINISRNNTIYIKVYASNLNLLMYLQAARSNPEGISDILIPSFNQWLIGKNSPVPQTTKRLIEVWEYCWSSSADPLEEQKKIARARRFSGTHKAIVLS